MPRYLDPCQILLSLVTLAKRPVLEQLEFIDSLPDALEELAAVEAGEAGPPGGDVHPGHVVHRTEHADLVVDAAVRLHAFEQLLHTISRERI